ncbi:MAG: helix-turn-helix transcriptional regulator [Thiohalobacteraceae bacterium]
MTRTTDNSQVQALLKQILAVAKTQGIPGKELAVRAGIAPETLSRMKGRGSGDAAVLDALARVVGLRLALVPDDERLEAIRSGDFF